jgi:hypothetical protein
MQRPQRPMKIEMRAKLAGCPILREAISFKSAIPYHKEKLRFAFLSAQSPSEFSLRDVQIAKA